MTSVIVMGMIGALLFRIGAIGGADFKALLTTAILSPGFEFVTATTQYFDGVVVSCLELVITLGLGVVVSMRNREQETSESRTPLIPLLLIAYLLVQTMGLVILIMVPGH